MKTILGFLVLPVALAFGGCGSDDCIIVSASGNKLCGDDARAWCDSTDGLRRAGSDLATDPDYGDPNLAASVSDSQAACDAVR